MSPTETATAATCTDMRAAYIARVNTSRPNSSVPKMWSILGAWSLSRKHIGGGRISKISQRNFDRIFEMEIENLDRNSDENSEEEEKLVTKTLIAELMGKHSNIVLISEQRNVLDSAKRVSHKINRFRETLPGQPYLSPPSQKDRHDPFFEFSILIEKASELQSLSSSELADLLGISFLGVSPFLAQELAHRILNASDFIDGVQNIQKEIWEPTQKGKFSPTAFSFHQQITGAYPFPLQTLPEKQQTPADSLNEILDMAFENSKKIADFEATLGELRGRVGREIKRLEKVQQSQDKTIAEGDKAESHREMAELILANIWQIQPEMTEIVVPNYFDPNYAEKTIALEPNISPQENAEIWFRRYRKAKDSVGIAEERFEKTLQSLEILEEAKEQISLWEKSYQPELEAVLELREELTTQGVLQKVEEKEEKKKNNSLDFQGHKIRRYTTPDGYEILQGETATANDYLTTRIASPNDYWLHVRSTVSAHVVIRTHGKPEDVPRSVLEYAAKICALHSQQKHSALVPVDYTLKKYVRKPRGSNPGGVDYQQERTIHITLN